MSDYIDRAALGIDFCDRSMFHDPLYADGWNAAIQIIKDAPCIDVPESNVGKWIPVSERLPERNGKYMVHVSVHGNKYIDCASFAQDLYRIAPYDFHGRKGKSGFFAYDNEYGFCEYEGVTHWMPLPEPPKGE